MKSPVSNPSQLCLTRTTGSMDLEMTSLDAGISPICYAEDRLGALARCGGQVTARPRLGFFEISGCSTWKPKLMKRHGCPSSSSEQYISGPSFQGMAAMGAH